MNVSTRSRELLGRSAETAALVALATLSYLALVVGLGWLLGEPADRPSLALSVLATTVAAVSLEPARRRIRRMTVGATREDQLVRITSEMSDAMPAQEVLPRIARAVAEATSARAAEIRVRGPGAEPILSRWPSLASPIRDSEPDALVRPIVSGADSIGELVLRLKLTRSGRPRGFPQAERRLLDELVARAGLTVENVRLQAALRREIDIEARRAEELRNSRRRVVQASDAELHRLERDIHDGAQQHLVAMSVNLGLASVQCSSNPAGAEATLDRLVPAVRRALAELDDLGRGIYPRALIAGGVPGALAALAALNSPTVALTVSGPDERWPRDIEAAVYFTCAEAIQNAMKHARAGRVDVRLEAGGADLTFQISDDGEGFEPPRQAAGTGLSGMRDRLEAVGGVLRIASSPGRGTTVIGQLRLPEAIR